MDQDRLGRRRRPNQERGLRPLHPLLPDEWTSRALRVAMSELTGSGSEPWSTVSRWTPTQARAAGGDLELIDSDNPQSTLVRSSGWTGNGKKLCGSSAPPFGQVAIQARPRVSSLFPYVMRRARGHRDRGDVDLSLLESVEADRWAERDMPVLRASGGSRSKPLKGLRMSAAST